MYIFVLIKGEGLVTDFYGEYYDIFNRILGDRETTFILDRTELHREGIFYVLILSEAKFLLDLTEKLNIEGVDMIVSTDVSLPYDLTKVTQSLKTEYQGEFLIECKLKSELDIIINLLDSLNNLEMIKSKYVRVSGGIKLELSSNKQIELIEVLEGLKLHPFLNTFKVTHLN